MLYICLRIQEFFSDAQIKRAVFRWQNCIFRAMRVHSHCYSFYACTTVFVHKLDKLVRITEIDLILPMYSCQGRFTYYRRFLYRTFLIIWPCGSMRQRIYNPLTWNKYRNIIIAGAPKSHTLPVATICEGSGELSDCSTCWISKRLGDRQNGKADLPMNEFSTNLVNARSNILTF